MHIVKRNINTFETERYQKIIEIVQELQAEMEELKMQNAVLQEEAWQNDTLWQHASQFIGEKGLSDEYHEWVKKR